jgi:hypothetical protein
MSDDTSSKVGRAIVLGLLMMGTLGFGAAFTAIGMAGVTFSEHRDPYAIAIFIISVPSLLIGGGLAWRCVHALSKRFRDDD